MSIRFYAVRRMAGSISRDWSKRVTGYHDAVFHGVSLYVNRKMTPNWRPPSKSNSNREPVHLSRSGRFIPSVFGSKVYDLIVSEEVRQRLADVPEIEFNPVVFERLVDVAMPAVGDFSWVEEDRDPEADDYESRQLNPNFEFTNLPDIPEFHESIGPYYSVLAPNFFEVEDDFADVEEIVLHWGDYKKPHTGSSSKPISLSEKLLSQCPMIRSHAHIFREDVFGLIAPFLDLDYYSVAVGHIGPDETAPAYDAYMKSLRESIRSREE